MPLQMSVADVVAHFSLGPAVPRGLLVGLVGQPDRARVGPGPVLLVDNRVLITVPRDARLTLEQQSRDLFFAARASECVLVLYGIEQPASFFMDIVLRACDESLEVITARYAVPPALGGYPDNRGGRVSASNAEPSTNLSTSRTGRRRATLRPVMRVGAEQHHKPRVL